MLRINDRRRPRTKSGEVNWNGTETPTRPDGYLLRWTLASPGDGYRGLVPFLIADDTPRRERVPSATAHANRVTGLGSLTIAVTDLVDVTRWYSTALGLSGIERRRDDLAAVGYQFSIGPHDLELVTPERDDGPVAAFLRQRGPGLYAATLTTATGTGRWLPDRQSQGARLYLE